MSNFYYCKDCEKETDLKLTAPWDEVCVKCGGTNWVVMIDSPGGEPEERK